MYVISVSRTISCKCKIIWTVASNVYECNKRTERSYVTHNTVRCKDVHFPSIFTAFIISVD